MRDADLKRKYGINRAQYDTLVNRWTLSGKRVCPLCEKPFSHDRLPAVDHRHCDGLVRGVICTQCNDKLGYDHENDGWYERAARYLRMPPAPFLIGRVYVPDSPGAAGHTEEC